MCGEGEGDFTWKIRREREKLVSNLMHFFNRDKKIVNLKGKEVHGWEREREFLIGRYV